MKENSFRKVNMNDDQTSRETKTEYNLANGKGQKHTHKNVEAIIGSE